MIKVQVVADSLSPYGNRLFSILVTFPRFILAELNTHRMLSKNSASSRAIPFNKMVESVTNNPFIPIAWQKEHKGMQGTEYLNYEEDNDVLKRQWILARDYAIQSASRLTENLVTKQLANRLLEPFMYHTVLITASEWMNFFELRCPQYAGSSIQEREGKFYRSRKDWIKAHNELDVSGWTDLDWLKLNKGQAEIHMMALAEAIWDAYNESKPKELKVGEWHIIYEDRINDIKQLTEIADRYYEDFKSIDYPIELIVKIATAMAARTSYTTVGDEKEFTYEQQIALHDRMANQRPFHASPFEHCARVMTQYEYESFYKSIADQSTSDDGQDIEYGCCRNFSGFIQYRHLLESGLSV